MIINGSIYAEGPRLLKKLIEGEEVCFDNDGREFIFNVKDAAKEKVDVKGVTINLENENITINPIDDSTALEEGHVTIWIEYPGDTVEVAMSIGQAQAIKEFLENCIMAHYYLQQVSKEKKVKVKAKPA
jgi:hypothetical protein